MGAAFTVYEVKINVPEQTKILWAKYMEVVRLEDWDVIPLAVQGIIQTTFAVGVAGGMRVALEHLAAAQKAQRQDVADRN